MGLPIVTFVWDDRPGMNVDHIAHHGLTPRMWEDIYHAATVHDHDKDDPHSGLLRAHICSLFFKRQFADNANSWIFRKKHWTKYYFLAYYFSYDINRVPRMVQEYHVHKLAGSPAKFRGYSCWACRRNVRHRGSVDGHRVPTKSARPRFSAIFYFDIHDFEPIHRPRCPRTRTDPK